MAALISVNLKGGGAPGSNSPSLSKEFSFTDVSFNGALTFNAQFLCLELVETLNEEVVMLVLQNGNGLILMGFVFLDVSLVLGWA